MKNLRDAHDVPYGTGISNIAGVLDELKRQHFVGNISIEYEYNWKNNVIDCGQCVGFVRRLRGTKINSSRRFIEHIAAKSRLKKIKP
ncbi:MAG: hypothetical protein WDN00_17125 [Limisphaerales bacterium]